jgi:hypothetical protein
VGNESRAAHKLNGVEIAEDSTDQITRSMYEEFPDFYEIPEDDFPDLDEVTRVVDRQLAEARAELYRLTARLTRNARFRREHLCKRHSPEERLRRAQEGRTTRGCGAQNDRCTVKSRGGQPTAVTIRTTTSAEVRRR